MAKINYNDIEDINVSWENYAGSSVEKFIKKELNNRAGYIYRSQTKEGDYYYLYGFTDYDQFNAWSEGDTTITPLFKVQLPNVENDTFSANLYTNSNTKKLVNLGDGVKVGIRYTSTATNPTTGSVQDTYNDGTLIISRSANGSAYQEVARLTISPISYSATTEYEEIDITEYLVDGDNKVRMRVEDNVNGSISTNLIFQSIVNTTLLVENATSTLAPLTATQFQYYIQGQVSKTLHIKISQNGINNIFTYAIGESTYLEVPYTTPLMSIDLSAGTVEVETWLTVDDTTLESTHITNQYYYDDGTQTSTVIILNNVAEKVVNYTNVHLFDLSLYNQSANITISIKSEDAQTEYLNIPLNNCETGTLYPVYTTPEIESDADTFKCIVQVYSDDYSCEPYNITIDNTEKMSPTAGADFILNPKIRNNSEVNPERIINSADNKTISSTFTNFKFINDGWVYDENNIQVLRIPAEHRLEINYDALNSLTDGTTIEVDFKTFNVFDESDIIFSFSSETDDGKPLGFLMCPVEAAFYTAENQTKRDQDVIFQDETRTHLTINILPNLANSGLNYIRMFINGVMNREILYSDFDVFKNGTISLKFGSEHSDLDIYGIRVYKKGLSASDVRQDYMSSIPNNEDKLAFKAANNILTASGTISYYKASVLYNTLIWTGEIPSYSNKKDSYPMGFLDINIINDTAHSGRITNLRIKGQGSSSKGYWKWNHQYDFNKFDGYKSTFTNLDGENFSGYSLTDSDPEAKKLVAKLNWASSMQSHKLGSTALYTDLWRNLVGGNGITKTEGYENVRVSVHQKPFMYFVREKETDTPVFYGLMTFGSGKADKPTFGYNKKVFPDYLMLEGSDNGMPLTLRQVPWFDDEVIYNEDEEYYEYAGQGNLDYDLGNQESLPYFKAAFNFAYLHSPFLLSFTDSIPSNANAQYQYYDSSTLNVYRYDYISKSWVNAGITKTDGEYDVLNLETQTGLLRSDYSSEDEYTAAVIAWRIADFRNKIGIYYNTNDVIYSMSFLKLVAASDNWCKNTYEYLDPVSHKICMVQDDMDTLMLTDNVGRKTKPYYVEEHDLTDDGKPYFNGSDNVFFNLMEMAFESEQQNMMKQILNKMRNDYNTAYECIQEYFFDIQEYFPAVAFNETARLLYEEAAVAQSEGKYSNATPPITQSLGDQLQAERQWWKRRLTYMQSWAAADPFYTRSTTEPSIMFRSMTTTAGANPTYQFKLTPWQWLYPKIGTGQFLSYDNTRVPSLTEYTTIQLSTDGNTDTYLYGSDYYINFGEFGGVSLSEAFNLNGKRLLEFSADSRNVDVYEFRPTSMSVNCPALRSLVLYGCSTLSGALDLSGSEKLELANLKGTSLNSLVFPETETLTEINIPAITSLTLLNCPNLTTITADLTSLINLTTDNNTIASNAIISTNSLAEIHYYNVDLDFSTSSTNSDKIYNLLIKAASTATGHIILNKALTQDEKDALIDKYGNIDDSSNDLWIEYTYSSFDTFDITGDTSIAQGRTKTYKIEYAGNDAVSYTWAVQNAEKYTSSKKECIITAKSDSLDSIYITCTLTKVDGSVLLQEFTIGVIENVFIESISVDDLEISSINTFNIPITYTPENYTVDIAKIGVDMDINNYAALIDYTTNNIQIESYVIAEDEAQTVPVNINIKDIDGNVKSTSFNLYFTNPITQFLLNGEVIWSKE